MIGIPYSYTPPKTIKESISEKPFHKFRRRFSALIFLLASNIFILFFELIFELIFFVFSRLIINLLWNLELHSL